MSRVVKVRRVGEAELQPSSLNLVRRMRTVVTVRTTDLEKCT